MESGKDVVLGTSSGTGTSAESTAASGPSTDSTERSCGREGGKRRVRTPVTSSDSGDTCSGFVRVLRPRRAGAADTCASRNITGKKNMSSLRDACGRPVESRITNTPVIR